MKPDRERLYTYLKRLKLRKTRELLEAGQEEVLSGFSDPLELIFDIAEREVSAREETRKQRRFKKAGFPSIKTIADFDFGAQQTVDEPKIRTLSRLDFMNKSENVVFLGPPGVGKTHLAIALGVSAIEGGYDVLFSTAEQLVDTLYASLADGTFKQRLGRYGKYDLLIIDELGFLNLDRTASNHFFQVINQAYEHQSIILTSNRPFQEWAGLFDDSIVVSAILDRLLHHAHLFNLKGHSYRLKDKLQPKHKEVTTPAQY